MSQRHNQNDNSDNKNIKQNLTRRYLNNAPTYNDKNVNRTIQTEIANKQKGNTNHSDILDWSKKKGNCPRKPPSQDGPSGGTAAYLLTPPPRNELH